MFCIKCGKPAKIGNFCNECFLERESLFDVKDFTFIYCDLCGLNEKELIERIKVSVRSNNEILGTKVSTKTVGNKVHATVTCIGKIKGLKKEEAKKSLVILRQKMCDMHVKLSGGYYEAVIQVRGVEKEDILKRLMKIVPEKSIINVEKLREGYNIKIMRKANAAAAAKRLGEKFSIKSSFKLVGSKKGMKLYRNFYAIR